MLLPATVTGAVHNCGTPVRLSTHSAWKSPSGLAVRPLVSPPRICMLSMPTKSSLFPSARRVLRAVSVRGKALLKLEGAAEILTLDKKVSPPSNDAENRGQYPRLSALSRRAYHMTPTTPAEFTATAGMKSSLAHGTAVAAD